MKARLLKEARQLLPVWVAALLLATMPISLWPSPDGFPAGVCFVVGLVMLTVACFGREFSQRTFAIFAVQPVSRERLWWEKVSVLAAATICTASMFVVFCKASTYGSLPREFPASTFALYAGLAAFGGGLFMTLALRQILASICFTLLFPIGLMMTVSVSSHRLPPGWESTVQQVVLVAYSIVTFLLARRLFLRAQDVQWTGGTVALPAIGKWISRRSPATTGKCHPVTALVRKEFQLQQVSFLLAGVLLVLQIAVLLLPKLVTVSESSALAIMVNGFWILWLVVPLLVGCSAVAEEQRLGTLEPQLCLPISRAWQFALKIVVTLACGVFLGAFVPIVTAVIAPMRGTSTSDFSVEWVLSCAGVTLISLYASTLTRHLLQAFSVAIGLIFSAVFVPSWLMGEFTRGPQYLSLFGYELWHGPLVFVVGAAIALVFVMFHTWSRLRWFWVIFLGVNVLAFFFGTFKWALVHAFSSDTHLYGWRFNASAWTTLAVPLVVLMSVLAGQNFKHLQTSMTLWMRDSITWISWLAATAVITTLVYHRVWELAMQFEPPAGPPRLLGSARPVVAAASSPERIFVLLPDGRIWTHSEYEFVPASPPVGKREETWTSFGLFSAIKKPHSEFMGSNWIAIAPMHGELVAIRGDGSLWKAYWWEYVDERGSVMPICWFIPRPEGWKLQPISLKFVRIGMESDWMSVSSSSRHFIALKRDGSIWGWGDNDANQLGAGPKFITNAPTRIGDETDWKSVFAGYEASFAVKNDGGIWSWGDRNKTGPVKLNINVPGVRLVRSYSDFDLVLDTNGDLWGLGKIPPGLLGPGWSFGRHVSPKRLGGQRNVTSVFMDWTGIVSLRSDGSLCDQRSFYGLYGSVVPSPSQLGRRNDWLAVGVNDNSVFALAKDGTLCRFGEPYPFPNLLAPTRRVTWSVNVLDASK